MKSNDVLIFEHCHDLLITRNLKLYVCFGTKVCLRNVVPKHISFFIGPYIPYVQWRFQGEGAKVVIPPLRPSGGVNTPPRVSSFTYLCDKNGSDEEK